MMFPKHKRVILDGAEKSELRDKIFERDDNHCIICGDRAEEWHHVKRGCNRSDEIDCGVALCHQCHTDLHSNPRLCKKYKELTIEYLRTYLKVAKT